MQDVTRQLEQVRHAARRLLVGRRLLQWIAGVLITAVGLGLIDFALRLPGWLRLIVICSLAAFAGTWLVSRLGRALQFWPSLSELALRAERMYPQLSGALASAVDFDTHTSRYADPAATAAMAQHSIERARQRLEGVDVLRLIDRSRVGRAAAAAAAAAVAVAAIVAAVPDAATTAVQRWALPLSGAQWPNRVEIAATLDAAVWAVDAPLPLRAQVQRGASDRLRVWAHYRTLSPSGVAGPWQQVLLNPQARPDDPGRDQASYERLLELPAALVQEVQRQADPAVVQVWFEAYDGRTPVREVRVVARPEVLRVAAHLTPPAYAADLVDTRTVPLDDHAGQVASITALQGSLVSLELTLNKPLPPEALTAQALAPRLPAAEASVHVEPGARPQVRLSFPLKQTLATPITLLDEHGLSSLSERLYRFEVMDDRPPAVAIVQPSADVSVLPRAVLPVSAMGQDDVGLRRLALEMQVPAPDSATEQTTSTVNLAVVERRRANLTASATLDLQPLELRPGQVVRLGATAYDVFDLAGLVHDPVQAPPRTLRIIDEATLVGQIRQELATLRQQAIRVAARQRELQEAPVDQAAAPQQQVGERLGNEQRLIEALRERSQRNRLDEPALSQVLERSDQLIDEAREASATAAQQLAEARESSDPPRQDAAERQARAAQEQVARALKDLTALLDQGQDALTLQLALRELQTRQARLSQQTRQLLPQTIGQDRADLPEPLQQRLDDLAREQAELSEQARESIRQMQAAAEALAQQDGEQQQAAAQALAEAAAIAQRQGLQSQMQEAAQQTEQNQLSQAGRSQASASDTMQQMLEELDRQTQRAQAMLRRRLQELAEALRQLMDRQERQIAVLDAAQPDALGKLEPGLAALRRQTMAVQEQAAGAQATAAAAQPIGAAVDAQGAAIRALRASRGGGAREAEVAALEHLRAALALVEQAQQQAQADQAQEQREKLREQYLALAQRQDALAEQTRPLAEAGRLDRRERAQAMDLGRDEQALREEIAALREQVAGTTVFAQMHRWIDEAAQRVATQLLAGRPGGEVLREQADVSAWLRSLADALQPPPTDDRFAEGGGGGGGGGGGQPPEAIPPLAELKALRSLQEHVYRQTRTLEEGPAPAPETRLAELGARQRELAEMGQAMIDVVRAQQQQARELQNQGEPDADR